MRLTIALLVLARLVQCQVESPITSSTESSTSIDTATPTITGPVLTPTPTIEQPTGGETTSIAAESPTTSEDTTLLTSVLSETSTSITESSSSSSIATDDETEITTTGSIQPESTSDAELDTSGTFAVPRELTADESVAITALDLETYADLLVNAPLPSESNDAPEDNVIALPACPVSGTSTEKRQILASRPKRPKFYPCMPNKITIEVIYQYVPSNVKTTDDRAKIRTRIEKQHAYFVKALGYFGIDLVNGEIQFRKATTLAADFTDHYFSDGKTTEEQKRFGPINTSYRKKTRVGGSETLNVWVVENIRNDEAGTITNGYADFPEERRFTTDGIIMNWNALRSEDDKIANNDPARRGNTLVHEFGHWMGLIHSFGDSNCGRDDGIADTYQTSNAKPGIYDDYQAVCGRPDLGNKWIHNFMSYSSVRSTYRDTPTSFNPKSFSQGQRAAMFSRFSAFRSGVIYSSNFCKESRSLHLSSSTISARDLYRRAEQKATLLADLLLNNCSIAIQDVYEEETIPLEKKALESISAKASSLQANSMVDSDPWRPQTATIGSGTAVVAATGGSGGEGGSATTSGKGAGQTGQNGAGGVMVSVGLPVLVAGGCLLLGTVLSS